ncbi:hypothetical protein AXK57_22030 [Tsukamurella pulmonis]|uniref:cutinase family protein n=1 Tax=Tsukamurella pulmonis TaxID=47312 RepID=UPI000794E326|nr:cutinase family protein [Tsukamurella pulmonis]KXP11555.1 hypothetical protein AXK57_22030 [Tsukamurella pulmonis]
MGKAKSLAATFVLGLIVALCPVLGGGVAAAAGCGTMQVIAVPGTTETFVGSSPSTPRGLLTGWGNSLQQQGASVTWTDYPAQVAPFAGQMNVDQSRAAGVSRALQQAQDIKARCGDNTQLVFGGYSQGAEVAGTACAAIGNGSVKGITARDLKGCELFGDPGHGNGDKSITGQQTSCSGIFGNGRDYGAAKDKVRSASAISDPFSCYGDAQVAAGLGGRGGAKPSAVNDVLNFQWPWAGDSGLPAVAARNGGSFVPLLFGADNPHLSYDKPMGGQASATQQSVKYLTSGQGPAQKPATGVGGGGGQPAQVPGGAGGQQAAAVAQQVLPGLAQIPSVFGGGGSSAGLSGLPSSFNAPDAAASTPAPSGLPGGSVAPQQAVNGYGTATIPTAPVGTVAVPQGTSTGGALQNVDGYGLGTTIGSLLGTR